MSLNIFAASIYSAFSIYGLGFGKEVVLFSLFCLLAALSFRIALCRSFSGFFSIVSGVDGGIFRGDFVSSSSLL